MKKLILLPLLLSVGCSMTPLSNTEEDVQIQTAYYQAALLLANAKQKQEPTLVIECPDNKCNFDRITYNSPLRKDNSIRLERAKTSAENVKEIIGDVINPIASVFKIGLGAAGVVFLNKNTAENAGSGNTHSRISTVGDSNTNTSDTIPNQTTSTQSDNNSIMHNDDNSDNSAVSDPTIVEQEVVEIVKPEIVNDVQVVDPIIINP